MIQRKDEKLIEEYNLHCRRVERATQLKYGESPAEKAKRIKKLESKYTDWFEYYFPHYATAKCAWYHALFAKLLLSFPICFILFQVFRSGAKSVHACMGVPMFLMIKKQLFFMLLVGQTEKKAKKLLSDIQANLQYNQLFINDYGKKMRKGSWSDGDFTTSDGVKFVALGFGQSPRGIRELYNRPDYIVVSDVDTKERCNNDKRSDDAYAYVWEDLKGCFDEGGKYQRMIVENNNFHKNTIINKLGVEFKRLRKLARKRKEKPRHHIIDVPAVKDLKTFEPNWKEKTDANYWRRKFEETPYRSFMREYMHKHIQDGKVFSNDKVLYKKRAQYRQYDGLVVYGDLSYKDTGDYKGIMFLGKIRREYHVLSVYNRQESRALAAEWLYNLYEDKNLSKYNIRYYIEGLFAMDEFVTDFDAEGDQRGYHIPVESDEDPKGNKYDRIEAMTGIYQRKWIFIDENIKDDPDVMLYVEHLLAFEKGSKTPVDILDAQQGGISKLNKETFVSKFEIKTTSIQDTIRSNPNRF
ncbi:hypothetical protein KORDIASMS9_02682 [Kordia sp. SMS9]|uniref:hypothetical protein n=1 Tax=Kordia sp. SMS9 TaxID=2282170 RepID=UPI000E0D8B0C|nr:hypothetical protein [Kordia sp. SMS9]AXG70442.1 hypothetical protein KORDIASMS9_02682 [Kordia sp. SMS9]